MTAARIRVLIVGAGGGTNVGQSLCRGARELDIPAQLFNASEAMSKIRPLQTLFWRLGGRRPVHLRRFGTALEKALLEEGTCTIIATGAAPIMADHLRAARSMGVRCINFSTDDPWNPALRAGWFLNALPHYDAVFTPRRANIADFRALGCADVRYLPFGYDSTLFHQSQVLDQEEGRDILFVGGADGDRVRFLERFMASGLRPVVVGAYWERYRQTRTLTLGHKSPEALSRLTAAAAVNVCLVRRANRDGHVMRSLEIAALGGFMIAEDTEDHRSLFGEEGECVLYFATPEQAAEKSNWALSNRAERLRMAQACHSRIANGRHTYADRLQQLLISAGDQ